MIDFKLGREIVNGSFRDELRELLTITKSLRKIGRRIFIRLLVSFLIISINVILRETVKGDEYVMILFAIIIMIIISSGLYQLMHFSKLAKKGWDIYEHLSDEIDWSNKRKAFSYKPPTEAKFIVREFLIATDLPLTKSSIGMAFYFTLYLIQLILSIVIIFLEIRKYQ